MSCVSTKGLISNHHHHQRWWCMKVTSCDVVSQRSSIILNHWSHIGLTCSAEFLMIELHHRPPLWACHLHDTQDWVFLSSSSSSSWSSHCSSSFHNLFMLICLCPCFCSFPCCRELYKFTPCVKQKPHIWLHLKHLEFCNFFNEKGKNFSDLHFAVKWRIIFPQDRIIVTLEKGEMSPSPWSWYWRKVVNIICSECSRALILKTTFYEHLWTVKLFETGGISQILKTTCLVKISQLCL